MIAEVGDAHEDAGVEQATKDGWGDAGDLFGIDDEAFFGVVAAIIGVVVGRVEGALEPTIMLGPAGSIAEAVIPSGFGVDAIA